MNPLQNLLAQRTPEEGPLLMGVVNVTPNSFSDGGMYFDSSSARRRVDELVSEGAQIIDIGGESTRPGSIPVPAEEQLRRIAGVIEYAVEKAMVSVDTTDAQVACEAVSLGASIINDISCLRRGPALAQVAAEAKASLIIMHAREPMSEMKGFSLCDEDAYTDVVEDVCREWSKAADSAMQAGMKAQDIYFDPGLGFNKSARHSSEILARLREFLPMGHGIVVGPGRKSFLCLEVKAPVNRRLGGTVMAGLAGVLGGASILRVHDVLEVRQALAVARWVGILGPSMALKGARDQS